MTKVTMTVNGMSVSAETEGRTLLSAFLREGLALTGTHIGCDTSQCGACVVHVDGVAVKSCAVFAQDVAGASVTTIEGMANPDGSLGVIQAAFQEHHGLQCGFCTSGMLMAAHELLTQRPNASREQVRDWISGNYCRCTGYQAIVDAICEVLAQRKHAATAASSQGAVA